MRRIQRLAATILIAALTAPSLAAAPGRSTSLQASSSLVAAGDTLRERLKTATATRPPMLTNADGPVIRAAFDLDYVRHMPLDAQTAGEACVSIGQSILAFVDYSNRMAAGSPNLQAASNATMIKLQDEVSLGAAAANLCVQRGFHAVLVLVEGMPAAQRSNLLTPLKQMRDGSAQTITGTLNTMLDPGMRPANRTLVLSAALEDANVVSASFPSGERAALRQQILALAPRAVPAVRAQWNRLAAAFARTDCNAMCEIAGR